MENEINKFKKKKFYIKTSEYDCFLEKKENEEIVFDKKINNINIISNNKTNISNSITCIKIKYDERQKINILHRFKYYFIFYTIFFILLNIDRIYCESYILVKINKVDTYKILFKGGMNNQDVDSFCRIPMHNPISMTINGEYISPPVAEYAFTQQNNTIKIYFGDNKNNFDCLFYQCSEIDEIDASHLKTSSVNSMQYMFYGCKSLTSLNISNFNTENVKYMRAMFYLCSSLYSIDVSHFVTSSLEDMAYMFRDCSKLTSIYLLNFDTRNVKYMDNLFNGCLSLTTLDISNFKTSKVIWMAVMFSGCHLLTTLDLSNFDTSSAQYFQRMFDSCKSLISLNLSNFNTSSAIEMGLMFNGCSSLKSLDITNFKTFNVNNMRKMFSNCISLTTLDLSHFDTSSVTDMGYMFYNCQNLANINLSNFAFSQTVNIENIFAGCSNLNYINVQNLIINDTINYTSFIDNSLINPVICIDDMQSLNKIISLYHYKDLVDSENWGVYKDKISNDNNIFSEGCLLSKYNNNCYQICSYYHYYDENLNKYICTESLQCPEPYEKLIYVKNECIKSCSETNLYKYEVLISKVCLIECPENFYKTDDNPFSCIPKCPEEKPFLLVELFECVSYCTIKQRQNKLCLILNIFSEEVNYHIFDEVINQARNELLKEFDSSVINGGIINIFGDNITITRTEKENKNDDGIYLGECEERLKQLYNIPQFESLYVLRLDMRQIGYKNPSL